MDHLRSPLWLVGASAVVAMLSACSANVVVWGPERAQVIETTERLIRAARTGQGQALACADARPDFGEPHDWEPLSAEEPEEFHADHWPESG